MATVTRTIISADLKVRIELNEEEVRALDAIFGYNPDTFLKVFYERMGKSYVQPHENGVRTLHKTIRGLLAGPIAAIDTARRAMNSALKA